MGDITSRVGSVNVIRETLTSSAIGAVLDGLVAVVTLAVMLRYSPRLAAVTLTAVALYLLLRLLAYPTFRRANEERLLRAAKESTHLLESLRGVQSVKLANKEAARLSAWQGLVIGRTNQDVRIAKMAMLYEASSQSIFGAERIAVIGLGATLVLENQFSIGMLVAYLAYKDQFSGRISSLIDTAIRLRMLGLHGERLADIVLTPPECAGHQLAPLYEPPDNGLTVVDLSFRYADGEPWVLECCSFRIEPGEAVAIVGPSGCGKTTLVKLLLGLLQPTRGIIAVGGVDTARLDTATYRAYIAAVMQDDQLFAGSVADNIAFGDDAFDLQRVEAAAKLAAVHDEIHAMPMGYHSLIGDMGTTLSGGQKQRVVLARALYRSPRILFLDEATSHLDVERERLVNEAVRALKLTRIIIAHRPETIASADRVLVMHNGRIVQELRPQSLPTGMPGTEGHRDSHSMVGAIS